MNSTQTLPDPERRIYDVLKLHSPNWIVSGDIAITLGHYQNYCAKLLSFLINKGLVESRPVENNGKIEHYYEYRLNEQKHPLEIGKKNMPRISNECIEIKNRHTNDRNKLIVEGLRQKDSDYLRLNSVATTFTLLHGCLNCCVYYRKAEIGKRCRTCK